MTKKVLIISSSPRRGGNTDMLCDEFMRGASEAGHEVEKVFLREKTIHYCTGCSTCSLHGKPCPQKDDAVEVVSQMVSANVIVLATPVYFYAMSAQMKTLIDRCFVKSALITVGSLLVGGMVICRFLTNNESTDLPLSPALFRIGILNSSLLPNLFYSL